MSTAALYAALGESPPLEAYATEPAANGSGRVHEPEPAATATTSAGQGINLRHIADIVAERREPRWLRGLHKVLERGVLGVLAGSRNTFKSFIGLHWTMLAALHKEPAVILSAEGAGLDRRVDAWMRTYAPAVDLRSLPLLALERALNLNAASTLSALRAAIDAHSLKPSLGMIDTFSKYSPGLDENDNAEVAAYLSLLSTGLRDHYDMATLIVAHAGHGDSRRPRGASVLMANPDAEYIVERPSPTAMTVTVSRERFKDSPALQPLAYLAQVVDLGRTDSYGEPVTSIVMHDTDLPTVIEEKQQAAGLRGSGQRQLLAALKANSPDGTAIWTLPDIREIGRKAGIKADTVKTASTSLSTSPHLTPTIGGWKLTWPER